MYNVEAMVQGEEQAMARKLKKKWVYRDNESNRLITKEDAKERDATTWTKEEFLIRFDEPLGKKSDKFSEPEILSMSSFRPIARSTSKV